ncbi:MAG: hypothetical protein QY329_07580 [Anaerolineales bacterium]|nr:MAG: hypothetical protein QY329_07580 [Anaerolineales bacterium]
MKRFLYASSILLFVLSAFFATPLSARASEGDGGHGLEAEVNGYHVTLDSQNEWAKGENVLVVTITDSMGMPLSGANVEILVAPKAGGHESPAMASPDSGQEEAMSGMNMGESQPEESSMPGMDTGNGQQQEPEPGVMKPVANNTSEHEAGSASPIAMTESEHGTYTAQAQLETSGEHDAHVMFHVNGEMLQADFVVKVTGSNSKTFVLWSFVAVNVAIVAVAGTLKKQKSLPVKGRK